MLTDVEAAIVADEEACLARIQAALAAQPSESSVTNQSANVAELRELRDEAASAREEEAASLMLELAVQQKLFNRTAPSGKPDPKTPYIGHLRLTEGKHTRDYFLGQATFIETRNNIRIVDWRVAPVAQIFYRYRQGDAFDEALPERDMTGTVDVRRIVVIHEGKLVQIMGDDVALRRGPDGTWESTKHDAVAFAKGSEGRLGLGVGVEERGTRTDVTALLDAQQYAAISAPPDDALVVLGSAGSGKTTVALHRLARLTTSKPDEIPLPRSRVVVPEEGLARLCRRILKPLVATLGPEVKPPVETLDEMAIRFARHALGQLPTLTTDTPALVTNLKRHPALHAALKERFTKKPIKRPTLARLLRHLGYALTDRQWLAGVVARAAGTLPTTAIEDTVRHTMLQFADKPVTGAEDVDDDDRKTALDGRGLDEGTPDELAQTLDAEDLPVLLSMLAWQGDLKLPQASHLVLDEAEDFSLFDLEVLRVATKTAHGVTLAGDEAQQTHSSFAGWDESLRGLGVKNAHTIRLSTSYRCPKPIAELARKVLGHMAPVTPLVAAREGVPVGRFTYPNEAQTFLFLSNALRDLVEVEPHATIAVICHDGATASRFYSVVKELPAARLVLDGAFTFESGVDVTDVDSVKGLEFDYVVIPDATPGAWPLSDDGRRKLHVAVTRASHQLWLAAAGKLNDVLA